MPATPKSENDRLDLPSLQERLENQRKKDQARRREYYAAHREERIARQKEYYNLHKKERNVYSRKYHKEHREKLEAYQNEYRASHREEQRVRNKDYYLAHQQSLQTRQRRYYSTHREEAKKWKAAQTKAVWDEIFRIYGDSCSCCGTRTRYFLTIHHVHGREEDEKGNQFGSWKKAIAAKDPKTYRILCFNCHLGGVHHNHRVCPHEGPEEWD